MKRHFCLALLGSIAFLLIGSEKASAQVVYNNTVVTPYGVVPGTSYYTYPYSNYYGPGVGVYGRYGYRYSGYRNSALYANRSYFGRGYTGYGSGYRTGYRRGGYRR
jgi:hypothetical protein